MPCCHLARALQRHVPCPPTEVAGDTVRAALDDLFARVPRLRGYVLDDQGAVRKHVEIYVDGRRVMDRRKLAEPVGETSRLHIFQALSGG